MTESVVPRTPLTSRFQPSQHTELFELWLPVPNWPGYEVSNLGRVRSLAGRIMTQSPSTTPKWNKTPYPCVRLTRDGLHRHIRVHRAVMAAFVGPLPEGMEVNHKDGDHWNNLLGNLEYLTKRQNEDHAKAHGLHPRGSRHGSAKLTEAQVREIRAVPTPAFGLAARYGVSGTTIQNVRSYRTWRHVS